MKTCPAAELKRAYPAAHMNLGILLGTQFPFTNWAYIRWIGSGGWRSPRAAELLGAACGGLLALISLREIKPSSPGLDPSNALRSCATHGQLDPTPWGPRALDPPVFVLHSSTTRRATAAAVVCQPPLGASFRTRPRLRSSSGRHTAGDGTRDHGRGRAVNGGADGEAATAAVAVPATAAVPAV